MQTAISAAFSAETCTDNCGKRNPLADAQMRVHDACSVDGGHNVEKYTNWEIVAVRGLDDIADREFTTDSTVVRSGVSIVDQRTKERKATIVIGIELCDDCDMPRYRRELADIFDCKNCNDSAATDPSACTGDELVQALFGRMLNRVPDRRYCILNVTCCGLSRSIAFVRESIRLTRQDGNYCEFTISLLLPNPYWYDPKKVAVDIAFDSADLTTDGPEYIDDPMQLIRCASARKCVQLPYNGNAPSQPKITLTGNITNPVLTLGGNRLDLNRRGDYTLGGCNYLSLNFVDGQQSFTDGNGANLYADLSTGCTADFQFDGECATVELCIEGEQLDANTFQLHIEYWNWYDGFVADPVTNADVWEAMRSC